MTNLDLVTFLQMRQRLDVWKTAMRAPEAAIAIAVVRWLSGRVSIWRHNIRVPCPSIAL